MTSSLPVIERLFEAADRALYQMKCSGGGGVIAPCDNAETHDGSGGANPTIEIIEVPWNAEP